VRSFRVLTAVVAVIALPVVTLGASMPTGTTELSTRAYFSHTGYSFNGTSLGSSTSVLLSLSVGQCITDLVELQGSAIWNHDSVDPKGDTSASASSYGASGSVLLNLTTSSSIVPYLQAGVGLFAYSGDGYEDAETSTMLPFLAGGLRFLVADSAALDAGLAYQRLTNAGGVEDVDADQIFLGLGISLLLHRK
jgi:hypothetical protein